MSGKKMQLYFVIWDNMKISMKIACVCLHSWKLMKQFYIFNHWKTFFSRIYACSYYENWRFQSIDCRGILIGLRISDPILLQHQSHTWIPRKGKYACIFWNVEYLNVVFMYWVWHLQYIDFDITAVGEWGMLSCARWFTLQSGVSNVNYVT